MNALCRNVTALLMFALATVGFGQAIPRTTQFTRGLLTNTTAAASRVYLGVGTNGSSGDVTAAQAFLADSRVIVSDGTDKGVKKTGISIDTTNNVTGITSITIGTTNIIAAIANKLDVDVGAVTTDNILDQTIGDIDLDPDAISSRFDAGQFNAISATVAAEPGVTNAAGASINFDWAYGAAPILRTTNSSNQTVTMVNVPTLTGRSRTWKLELIGNGTSTLALAVSGGALELRSGIFVNPPPAGLNEYVFQRIDGTNYYDVLRPAISTTKRVLGRSSAGAGDVEELDLKTLLAFNEANATGDMLYYNGGDWFHLGIGADGEVLFSKFGVPTWDSPGAISGFDFTASGTSQDATPSNLYTNAIAENTTVSLQAKVVGAGTTNSGSFDVSALVRRDTGGSASLIDTNNNTLIPASPEASAYWTLSGNDALLQVIGITNNIYTWSARGWADVVFNGTNTYTTFTSGYNGVNTWWDSSVQPTGLTDGKQLTLAFWWDQGTTDGVEQHLFKLAQSANNRLLLRRTTTNTLQLICYDSSTAQVLNAVGSATVDAATGWQHYFITFDLTDTNKRFWFVNGTNDTAVSWNTYTDATIDFQPASSPRVSVAATYAGAAYAHGDYADFYFNDSYFTAETPVGYFVTASNRPMSLGSDGSTPSGSAPVLYMSGLGGGNSWTNTASAYALTLHGTLTEPTPP